MATGIRKRYDFQKGDLGAELSGSGTTITFAVAPGFDTLAAGEYIPLALSEDGKREIVHLTAYTAGALTGTVERGQEGTGQATPPTFTAAGKWLHGPTAKDLDDAWSPDYPDLVQLYRPVASWMLDGASGADEAGNHRGTFSGTVASGAALTTGAANSTVFTSAGLTKLTVPNQPMLSPQANPNRYQLTLMLVLNLDAIPANGCFLLNKAEANAYEWGLSVNSSGVVQLSIWTTGGAGIYAVNGDAAVSDALVTGVTYHLAATFDYERMTGSVYINGADRSGAPTTSIKTNGPPTHVASNVAVGVRGDGSGSHLDGRVQGAAVFPYALSPSQIAKLAAEVL